mgnify:CR=1 FL=1
MKTTVKRTLSLLLAAASMASVLTACGSKDTAAADTSADTQAVSASADASDLGPDPYQGVRRNGNCDGFRLYAV